MENNSTYMVAKQKLSHYCSYQERTITEAQKKSQAYKDLNAAEANQIIQELIQENFLDQKRYAIAFVRGKFFIKKWGKAKIEHALRNKKIEANLIQEALNHISDEEYTHTLQDLILKKKTTLGVRDKTTTQKKLIKYLLQKGYELELIQDNLQKIL